MPSDCNVIVFFPIYDKFAAIQKSYSGRMVYKTYIFINSNHLSYSNWNQN